ncbi:MAG: aldehyde dehydrogenase (NADP(+)) [Aggregatilineaceae bacterium]
MPITGHNLIAGQYSNDGALTFRGTDPRRRTADDTVFYEATPDEIDRAVRAAADAFAETRTYPPRRLADFLERVADEIEALGDVLLETADRETALGIPRLTGERARTTGQLRAFAALLREGSYVEAIIDTALPERQPTPRPDIRRMLFPIGPVAVFAASNFPLAFSVAGGDTASAFAAGCPVILKAHPSHPATSELTAEAVNQAVQAQGFPAGFFSLVQGASVDVGQALVRHPAIEAVAFTGSLRGGRALFDTAAARSRPIPVYAEMGSVNPVFFLSGAIRDGSAALADGLVASVTLGAGQFCTNPGLLFVPDTPDGRAFVGVIGERMAAREPGVLLNAQIERGLAGAVAETLSHPGVDCLIGGEPVPGGGYCFANTVLQTTADVFIADPALQSEHFGPVTLVVLCADDRQMLAAVEALHGHLTASIHAAPDDLALAATLADRVRDKVGRIVWNGFPTGVEVVYAMQHGGPYPATTAPATTSVGLTAIKRFLRPVAFQNMPDALLPDALKNANPLGIWRIVNGQWTREAIG